MGYAISILGGYLVGTINPSYIIARIKGFDIRKSGSGNAGGSNAVITMGKMIGALCIVFDIMKAFTIIGVYLCKVRIIGSSNFRAYVSVLHGLQRRERTCLPWRNDTCL